MGRQVSNTATSELRLFRLAASGKAWTRRSGCAAMTGGEAESHADERAHWKELVSYGVAIFKLAWIAHERGMKLRNRDLDVSLCEDGLTVLIVVDDIARG